MKKRTSLIVFFSLICIIAAGSKEKKGIVTYTDGTVKKKTIEVTNWIDAPINTDIISGDKVRTYNKSRAEIDLSDLDIIRLAPKTVIDILKLYEETMDKSIKTEIKLNQGEIWASIHEVEMDTEFDISAPVAAAAITGTVLRMKVNEDTTTQLKVYKGEVKITTAPEKKNIKPKPLIEPHEIPGPKEIPGPHEVSVKEWAYIVKSMQQITFDKKGNILSKGNFNKNSPDENSNWVIWNSKRDSLRTEYLKRK